MNVGTHVGVLLSAAHRRNSGGPFTPLSISGCQLWLDVTQLTGGYVNNDPVSTWNDLSTHGRDATQAGALRPVYKTGIKNGLPALLFASSYMTGSLTLSQPVTIFVVMQHSATGANYEFYFDTTTNRIALLRLVTGSDGFDLFAGTDGSIVKAQDTNWHYICGIANGSSSIIALDAVATTGLASGANSLGATYYIGCLASTPGNFPMGGYISEIIVYDTALGTTNRQQVEAYLAAKWAI